KKVFKKHTKHNFPSDPLEPLIGSLMAVFGSWNNPRAIKYRELENIRGLLGTAVNIQAMVFGNMGETSGTGVGVGGRLDSGSGEPQATARMLNPARNRVFAIKEIGLLKGHWNAVPKRTSSSSYRIDWTARPRRRKPCWWIPTHIWMTSPLKRWRGCSVAPR
ncbi:MAG: hypothetical protein IIC27_03865, partial [Chloroflexi bacterium]|nr:hypothetical protein [Chloroflexota bacterium]